MHPILYILGLAALSAAKPTPTSDIAPRALSARALGLSKHLDLTKRLDLGLCPTGNYCSDLDTSCCGDYCCYSDQYCIADSFCSSSTTIADSLFSTTPSSSTYPSSSSYPSSYSYPSSSSSNSRKPNSSSTTTSAPASTSATKKTGFDSLSTGIKVAVILGPIVGIGLLSTLITIIACMTCCKTRNKPQKVGAIAGAGGQFGGGAPIQQNYTGSTQAPSIQPLAGGAQAVPPPPPPPPPPMQMAGPYGVSAPPYQQGPPAMQPMNTGGSMGKPSLGQEYQPPQGVYDHTTGAWTQTAKGGQVFEAPQQ